MTFDNLIVCSATLTSADLFFKKTLLGQSLNMIMPVSPQLVLKLTHGSSAGLAYPYNEAIASAGENDAIVFVHDDVFFDDWYFIEHLSTAFDMFDVVGVCGNTARDEGQQTWWSACVDDPGTIYDSSRRCGRIRHANEHRASILDFGPSKRAVKLLDGVFIAAKASALRRHGIRFDTRFKYHFYDLDFSRQCDAAGLRMGVWPIAMLHGSSGGYDEAWHEGRRVYFDKWGG